MRANRWLLMRRPCGCCEEERADSGTQERRNIVSLYVREAGPCSAPAVLFLHGLGLSGAMWQPQFERLADDFHCLAPDLPECGKSAAGGSFTLKDASRSVADLIRERIPRRSAHVVGISIGGAVALQMLCDEPRVLDHLLVSGAAIRLPPFLESLNRLDEKSVRLLNRERLAESLIRQYHVPQAYRSLLLADLRRAEPEALRHVSRVLTKVKLPTESQVPTLIAVGQEEPFVTKHDAYEMSRVLPGATCVLVPGVGHLWNLEALDLFTQTVRAWIQDEPLPLKLVPF
jgi:pimeloyl-ACP methyl ester carboxylesterase